MEYTCACGVIVKFNTRKMRYTTNSQNIVTLNNSDLKVYVVDFACILYIYYMYSVHLLHVMYIYYMYSVFWSIVVM